MADSSVSRQDSSPPNYGDRERTPQIMVVAEEDGHATAGRPNMVVPKDQFAQVWNLRAHSQPTHCPVCGQTSLTRLEYKVGHHTHMMAAVFATFLCCLFPYVSTIYKDVHHYCNAPNCGVKLAVWHGSERLEIIAKEGGTGPAAAGAPAQGPVKA